jgi:hypothetical protein
MQKSQAGEKHNIDLVREYMEISYTPGRASAQAVSHLCAPYNRFIAPTTFPGVHPLEEYAEDHGRLMEQVNDLHIVTFDVLFADADRVCLRYSAEGAHRGEPHGDIQPKGRTARGRPPPCSGSGRETRRIHQGVEQIIYVGAAGLASQRVSDGGPAGGRKPQVIAQGDARNSYFRSTDFPVAAA